MLHRRPPSREAEQMSDSKQVEPDAAFDVAFHYPPDLLEQLVDTISLLCKSKQAVLLFF